MKSIRINLRNMAIIFACLAATTVFASCEPAGTPAFTEFSFVNQRGMANIDTKKHTVKAVAECGTNLASIAPGFKLSPEGTTATVDGKAQESGKTAQNFTDAVVYTLTTPDGETAEWRVTITLPDDCPPTEKYLTYNKRVMAYYFERKVFDGDGEHIEAVAYDNKTWGRGVPAYDLVGYCNSAGMYYETIDHDCPQACSHYWHYGPSDWLNTTTTTSFQYVDKEYPLDIFAALVSANTLFYEGGLGDADIMRVPLPDHKKVTSRYANKSEKVMGIMCDVFTYSNATFWVDLTTGFTLKFEWNGTEFDSYEVTTLKIGSPSQEDWDKYHLRPKSGDNSANWDDCPGCL